MKAWALLLLLALSSPVLGAPTPDTYDYQARQRAIRAARSSRDWTAAYYQAAWLTWFAPKQFAQSSEGSGLLRDRRARDQASWAGTGAAAIAALAVETSESITSTCLDGAIATQASRLREETGAAIGRAEQLEAKLDRPDSVARAALARLYLSLDDCLALEDTAESRHARPKTLRKAASLSAAVAAWLPRSPGAHLLLATTRARLASLEDRAEDWEAALEACEMAEALDPTDLAITDMIWTLHLRAGHWAEAKRWENGGPEVKARGRPKGK